MRTVGPFSEAHFNTLKYRPDFPACFGCIQDARAHCQAFFPWYNDDHRYSGVAFMTPHDVHHRRAPAILARVFRDQVARLALDGAALGQSSDSEEQSASRLNARTASGRG